MADNLIEKMDELRARANVSGFMDCIIAVGEIVQEHPAITHSNLMKLLDERVRKMPGHYANDKPAEPTT